MVRFHPSRLDIPLRWRKPRRIFVSSMGDLFHEDVKWEWQRQIFRTMALAKRHTFILLTKRPERFSTNNNLLQRLWNWSTVCSQEFVVVDDMLREMVVNQPPLPNVIGMVTVENQEAADGRIPWLLNAPFVRRGVSVEPMLGQVDMEAVPLPDAYLRMVGVHGCLQPLAEKNTEPDDYRYFQRKGMKLDWVICGPENGPGARTMDLAWPRDLLAQCRAAGVPFFMKTPRKKSLPADLMVQEFPGISR
jgi:protein gp37